MMTKILTLSCAILMASTAFPSAHEFTELEIAGISHVGSYAVIDITNTVGGREIVCAVYDKNGKMISSDTQITDNLATQVIIGTERAADARAAKCVFND